MGKKIKEKAIFVTDKAIRKPSKKKLILSVISLVVTFAVLISTCLCWYVLKKADANMAQFEFTAGKGLRVNDGGVNNIDMAKEAVLIPATSVDGSNLFFPADGNFTTTTKDMIYRSANIGDRNINYAQIDFELSAVADYTAIYFDTQNTYLKLDNSTQKAAPLRIAIWAEADENEPPSKPIVFNSQKKNVTTVVPKEIDRSTGEVFDSATQTAYQFSEYAHTTNNRIATINKDQTKKFSIIIWLEGADSKCKTSIALKDIDMKFAFTTSWDNTEKIRFQDNSNAHWINTLISSQGYTLDLNYKGVGETKNTSFSMYPTGKDYEWSCSLPGDMKNQVSFILRPPATPLHSGDDTNTYVFCKSDKDDGATDTYNRDVNRLYVVENAASATPSACQGHWVALADSDGSGHDDDIVDGDDDF